MGPRRKRQRLSEQGAEAVTATADSEPHTNSAETAPKEASRKQLFVRGLAPTVTTQDLTDFFSESYPIKHALVVLDRESKESKGYGFVTFADIEDAQRAKEELDGSELQGRKIKVESAESRHRDADSKLPTAADRIKAEREQQRKDGQTPKLIIRNLPWSIKNPADLEKLFRSYGKIHFVTLPKKPSGELRGFAFVALRGKKNAEKAMEELNGKEIDGRAIAVDWAVDKDIWQNLQKSEQDVPADEEMAEHESSDEESSEEASSSEESSDEGEDGEDESDESNSDFEDISDSDEEAGVQLEDTRPKREEYTIFIRNLSFNVDDEMLFEHFTQFGAIRFARVVIDRDTERSKGTGFVCFFNEEDMMNCLKGVPRVKFQEKTAAKKDGTPITIMHSVLEDENADPTGKYTLDGRILNITRAVDRNEATRLTAEGAAARFKRDKDKRRLYLLSEGTIPSNSPLYQKLSPSEIKMREESTALRRRQIQENPSLHLSYTRLSVRNIPRSVSSKELKALARQAVVGFAADVRLGKRQKLSNEELARGGDAMLLAEKIRKKRGKGIVRQAKIVFETNTGSKVAEDTGAGRSRGYGFIEYYTHRNALMGLRWLNGHAVDYRVKGEQPKSKKAAKETLEDKKKRLIVEFAIENANVVSRRSDRETRARDQPKGDSKDGNREEENGNSSKSGRDNRKNKKRKHDSGDASGDTKRRKEKGAEEEAKAGSERKDGKLAQRTRIIARKRQMRRARKTEHVRKTA